MSNTTLIIEERSRDIGAFMVGRLLPFRKKRTVGPFIFIDHMGPETLGSGRYMDVDCHPHIGLATLTYLLAGEVMHRDSMGTARRITPGSVNLMVAGRGVTHTERTPVDLRDGATFLMHGYQIWIALPKTHEEMEPEFQHVEAAQLPRWQEASAIFTLIAGSAYGRVSPVKTFSELFMVEVQCEADFELNVAGGLRGEIGICIVTGSVVVDGETIGTGNMVVSRTENQCAVKVEAGSHLLLFGGQPLPEDRHMFWNFVSSSKDRLEQAKEDWRARRFPQVEGDSTYVPLPE